ncbi:MAG: class I SAM-dependent methyltransferase [Anaerolineae bacterium]|nr:class I SAM-dependent methyltransferase [Anaerolineae bacterium]
MTDDPHLVANLERYRGFAAIYDKYRPLPPPALVGLISQLAGRTHFDCVVDLASGSGISTRLWADHADNVIGIEPNEDMREYAAAQSAQQPHLRYQGGLARQTGLPDQCADVVSIGNALHWMEPVTFMAEVARLLRPNGVFCAFQANFPPTLNWQAELTDQSFMNKAGTMAEARGLVEHVRKWRYDEHVRQMNESGRFRYVKELSLHSTEQGNAERFVGLMLSQGLIHTLFKAGVTEAEIGIPHYRETIQRLLGDEPQTWYFSFRILIGIP